MSGFIKQMVTRLYAQYGDEISSLYVILPSRRAGLFFADALSQVTDKPIWQPQYISIDEIMSEISGLQKAEQIKLIVELYKIYSKHHKEEFDSFYYWGEMLLADFDALDKYLIDAEAIFSNIADLKELEDNFSYLTEEQIQIISQFWKNFGPESRFSDEQTKFITIWRSLFNIYKEYKHRLQERGVAYTGMLHRDVAERIKKGNIDESITDRRYVFAGFNALTECEKMLLSFLQTNTTIDIFWDYDNYYVDENSSQQEAGLFLRSNIKQFPQKLKTPYLYNQFSSAKDITIVEAPSNSLQCKYVHEFLAELQAKSDKPLDKETAIILTDENLLQPVLYSIPECIENINITMGYPFRQTLVYSFVERLIELQNRKRVKGNTVSFYHSDICGILSHAFILEYNKKIADEITKGIIQKQQIYVSNKTLLCEGVFSTLFSSVIGWENISKYIITICSELFSCVTSEKQDYSKRAEYLSVLNDNITTLHNSLKDCEITLSDIIYTSLLRRLLQSVRIPYKGEPMAGVQIMGILETRALDFENILILSVNEDSFPGSMFSNSFVPYNLRVAYGMPTPAHHEGVFAYYFYRLLQRAKRIDIAYCSKSDDKSSGERSRYLHQLVYESPHEIKIKELNIDINLSENNNIVVEKSGHVATQLDRFLCSDEYKLSPTSFYNYIECPLKFYFKSIAGIKPNDEVIEDVNSPIFGSILHRVMEILYTPIIEVTNNKEYLRALQNSQNVDNAVVAAINEIYLKDTTISPSEYGGAVMLTKELVCRYVNHCILPYDIKHNDFTVTDLEKSVECKFFLSDDKYITFGGKSDRIDRLESGIIRIVDYKSGSNHIEFKGIEALFSKYGKERSSAALQTLLYSLMLNDSGVDVQPALYYIIELNKREYSPLLRDKSKNEYVYRFSDYKTEFTTQLQGVVIELFDKSQPFIQCKDRSICQYCDYLAICGEQ